jgi:hypothetical protein
MPTTAPAFRRSVAPEEYASGAAVPSDFVLPFESSPNLVLRCAVQKRMPMRQRLLFLCCDHRADNG